MPESDRAEPKKPTAKPGKQRLDQLLVDRGLAPSREKAQALILAGDVHVDRQRSDKPGRSIPADAQIEVMGRLAYVSRGGLKLEGALDAFRIDPAGLTCVDIGSSTGGFTDCLLQRGAAKVWAFDVGRGQLDWSLRNDPRVAVHEGVNVRHLKPEDVDERFDLAVCDASFISLTLLLPAIVGLLKPDGRMVLLVKPQFEVGKDQVGKGGIVRDPALHQAACDKIRQATEALGFHVTIVGSPILGAEGNREFLLYARQTEPGDPQS